MKLAKLSQISHASERDRGMSGILLQPLGMRALVAQLLKELGAVFT